MTSHCRVAILTESESRSRAIEEFLFQPTEGQICLTSDELYHVVNAGQIDAIVVTNALGGFLTGVDIINRFADELVNPICVLVGDLTPSQKRRAEELRVGTILPADSTPVAIAAAIANAISKEIHSGLSIPHGARVLVRDQDYIAPMPQLLVRISGFLNDPNATVGMLAREISTDQRITAELLKQVNSSSFGMNHRVKSVQDAVGLIGVRRTVGLVLAAHLLGARNSKLKPLPRGLDGRLRMRSLLTAVTATTYSKLRGHQSAELAYVVGLLQDVGILILLHELGNDYQHTFDRCSSIAQLQLAPYEKSQLGFTHADVSAALLQKWELPPRLIRLVQQHHEPFDKIEVNPGEIELIQAMQIGESVADCREHFSPQRQILLNRLVAKCGGMNDDAMHGCLSQAVAQTMEMSKLFSLPMPDGHGFQKIVQQIARDADVELSANELAAKHPLGKRPAMAETTSAVEGAAAPTSSTDENSSNPPSTAPEVKTTTFLGCATTPQKLLPATKPSSTPVPTISQTVGTSDCNEPNPRFIDEVGENGYVVVVDDEVAIHELIQAYLKPLGLHVECCIDRLELALHARDADVIFIDMHLGDRSGIDDIRWLKSKNINVPVVVTSGDLSRSAVMAAVTAGAADFLPKPFDRQSIQAKVRKFTQAATPSTLVGAT